MTEVTYSIRPASEVDLSKISALELRAHVQPWTEEGFHAELGKPFAYVWVLTDDETDDELMGYIVFWLLDGQCRILNLVVEPEARGLGFGKRLLRRAIDEAVRLGVKKAVLEVRYSNQAAVGLYQKLGFTITRIAKNYYSDGENAYLMELELTGSRETF